MKSKKSSVVLGIVCSILVLLGVLLTAIVRWVFSVWKELNVNELVYHLIAPIKGTGGGLIGKFVLNCIVPTVLLVALFVLGCIFIKGKKKYIFMALCTIASLAAGVIAGHYAWDRLKLGEYISSQMISSSFIKDNYAAPEETQLTFPEKKRNLIYIYLESMETTFADKESGGYFTQNVIPELTEIAKNNECFSDKEGSLNGGYVLPCSDFTTGGMFAATAGLPLKLSMTIEDDNNAPLNGLDNFFPGVRTIGDILSDQGYHEVLFIGSEAVFGGKKKFFEQHGNYEIDDHDYAVSRGWIPSLYKASDWGYEDEKLFEFARERLTELAKEDAPFNFTMLTVDTHFEDGNPCRLCKDEFDDQYSNVYACSSRQVSEFVEWIKQQDFYENTTIVLSGDHLTMDSDYCLDVSPDYERKTYTAYINSVAERADEGKRREFSTMDNFPTTLAAMGVKIEGERLGLGTNLYSSEPTLIEQYGYDYVTDEINKRSSFMEKLSAYEQYSDDYMKGVLTDSRLEAQYYYPDEKLLRLNIVDVEALDGEIEKLVARYWNNNDPDTVYEQDFEEMDEVSFSCNVDMSKVDPYDSTLDICVITNLGSEYKIKTLSPDPARYNFDEFVKWLKELKGDGEHMIFVSVKEDATEALTDQSLTLLKELGLTNDFKKSGLLSYIAVFDEKGELYEEVSEQRIDYSGKSSDGKNYTVTSAGSILGEDESGSSIMIGGTDYSVNRRGFNIVLYSVKTGEVEYSVDFDTSFGYYVSKDRHYFRVN